MGMADFEHFDIVNASIDDCKELILSQCKDLKDGAGINIASIVANVLGEAGYRKTIDRNLDMNAIKQSTSKIYDAAWQLVQEGKLRPGPRYGSPGSSSPYEFAPTVKFADK